MSHSFCHVPVHVIYNVHIHVNVVATFMLNYNPCALAMGDKYIVLS